MSQRRTNNKADTDDVNLDEIPPIAAPVISGALIYSIFAVGFGDLTINLAIGGAAVILFAAFSYKMNTVYQQYGVRQAIDYAITPPVENNNSGKKTSQSNDVEKTPPASKKIKNELYFERADKQCEWCGKDIDSPDVHHIKPREEGGPNKTSNLIVLCPNCHRKADSGVISRSKLKYQVRKNRGE